MILGTTPTHTFELPIDFGQIRTLKITYSQKDEIVLEKYLDDCSLGDGSISVRLTQSDTFLFKERVNIEIQIRIMTVDGQVISTGIKTISADRCLDREVLE